MSILSPTPRRLHASRPSVDRRSRVGACRESRARVSYWKMLPETQVGWSERASAWSTDCIHMAEQLLRAPALLPQGGQAPSSTWIARWRPGKAKRSGCDRDEAVSRLAPPSARQTRASHSPIERAAQVLGAAVRMAFWAGRGGESWRDDGWAAEAGSTDDMEQEDALYVDEEDEEADALMADLFSMEAVEVDALDMVERLSWDAASEASSDEEEELPALLPIQVSHSVTEADRSLQWGLVSPCSEASSPRAPAPATLSPLTRLSISSPVRKLRFFEPEHEPTHETTGKVDQVIEEEEEEEVEPFDPETVWSPDVNSVLASPSSRSAAKPFASYEPVSPVETNHRSADDSISDSDDEDQQPSATSALRQSLLPRVPAIARWRRQKARTCSGAGSAGMPTALSLATFKARTRSLSRARNQSVDEEDDGDFSSDDEGYTPELHRRRASETEPLGASQWRRARHTSLNFASHRLSVSVSMSMSPAMVTKRLQDAKSKLNSGLHLLRSGSSASTVASEESYLDSPACQEIKSAPAGLHREPSIFSDDGNFTSLTSAASTCTMDADRSHPSRQQQLRAGMFKAAGMINAASAEAARKLKSRGFRAPHLPRQKTTASETEEEDPELPTLSSPIPVQEASSVAP